MTNAPATVRLVACCGLVLLSRLEPAGVRAEDRTPQGCAKCHAEIVQQWRCSAHARAWTSPELRSTIEANSESPCLRCHAPAPLLEQAADKPAQLRDDCRIFGVDCNGCHALGCDYAGPYDSWGPHGMTQETCRLRSSSFCGTCHEVEFQEYREQYVSSVRDASPHECVDCHMPAYRDRLTQKGLLSLLHPKRVVRDHSFPVWTERVLRGALTLDRLVVVPLAQPVPPDVSKERGDVTISFELRNVGAGHRIPTGAFGHREVLVQVELLDESGQIVGRGDQSVLPKSEQALVPGEATPFQFTLMASGARRPERVRVRVERVDRDRSFRAMLLCLEQPIETQD